MRLIRETVKDMRHILLILITILVMFTVCTYIIKDTKDKEETNVGSDTNESSSQTEVSNEFVLSLFTQYQLGLGEFDTENFGQMEWTFFILATFITQITIINMLIAVMSDTFDKVSERRHQAELQEKVKILSDW